MTQTGHSASLRSISDCHPHRGCACRSAPAPLLGRVTDGLDSGADADLQQPPLSMTTMLSSGQPRASARSRSPY
jgi:hypothetical protein